ncbi:MAG TPA: serine hydrolase domain-containing protein [Acidimicrobiales bacterium]|nr:serine hydrolase domain-containing protein [Acidimicrobiales bacterium]
MKAEVHGTCDARFGTVRDLLAASLERGDDVGASVAVTIDGELVVDLWGGWADGDRTVPWERDTITNVWSTTKTMTALCALMVADAGQLDLDAPVSRYWPEFAAAGKEDRVLVRHLLGHTAGLPGWAEPITIEDLYDWDKCTSLLAAQEPWWEPGTASGYHAITQGYLVGEVLRRVTGQTVGRFFRSEVAEPLGADFHIGLDPADFGRVSDVIPPPPISIPEGGDLPPMALRTLMNPPLDVSAVWTEGWRRAEIPAAGGHGNARSVATVQAIMANGGTLGGKTFLSEAGVERVLEEQADGMDLVLGVPLRFGMGYGLPSELMPINESGRACYWGGYGGSVIVVDMERRATFAYMMNRMKEGLVGDDRGLSLGLAVMAGLAA